MPHDLADQIVAALAWARRPLPLGGLLYRVNGFLSWEYWREPRCRGIPPAELLRPHLTSEAAIKAFIDPHTTYAVYPTGKLFGYERGHAQALELFRANRGGAVFHWHLRRVLRLPRCVPDLAQLELPIDLPRQPLRR